MRPSCSWSTCSAPSPLSGSPKSATFARAGLWFGTSARRWRWQPALALASLTSVALLCGCGGSSSHSSSAREVALQRAQFERVSHDLATLTSPVVHEAQLSRQAWRPISNGLPQSPSHALLESVARASTAASALPIPRFVAEAGKLTGPAAGIAGLYESFQRLSERGWRLIETSLATIASGGSPDAAFVRTNSTLYIDSIYDAHFNLSLLGKSLMKGYQKLGGQGAFGSKLTERQVEALAKTYSTDEMRLEPHPGPATEES